MKTPDLQEDALPPGTELGDYIIDDAIGRGGFAITYRGHHRQLTRQQVAIKEYFPETLARRSQQGQVRSTRAEFSDGRQEFLDEGQRLAALKHPNLIRVVNFFEANGTAYLVMDYEPGHTLEQHLKDGRRWEESRLRVLALKLLDALSAVHGGSLLHRDINPSNILLREDGEPVLIDFGAARSELAQRTRAVTSVVTDGYSPPEQYGTSAKTQGPWTDVYALGATLYQIATGLRPISSPERTHAVSEGEADPLPSASQQAQGHYSAELLAWIDELMAVQRSQRPQSAADALRGLQRIARPQAEARTGTRVVDESQRWAKPTAQPARQSRAPAAEARPPGEPEPTVASGHVLHPSMPRPRSTQRTLWATALATLLVLGGGWGVYEWRQSQLAAEEKERALSAARENEAAAWQQATQADTAQAYADFLELWPEGANASEAASRQRQREEQARLAQLSQAQREAERIKTIQRDLNALGYRVAESGEADIRTTEAIRQFEQAQKLVVTGTPDEVLAKALKDEIARRDEAAWATATKADSEAAYRDYQQKQPNGKHVGEVANRMAEARRKEEARQQEAARLAEEKRKDDDTRRAEETRIAEEKGKAEEKHKDDEIRLAEERRVAEQAKRAEEQRLAETTRLNNEKKLKAEAEAAIPNGGFIDLGNGLLRDTVTGLVWTATDGGEDLAFSRDAISYCERKGMRLPTNDELSAIVNRPYGSGISCGRLMLVKQNCPIPRLFTLGKWSVWSGSPSRSGNFIFSISSNKFQDPTWGESTNVRALCVSGE